MIIQNRGEGKPYGTKKKQQDKVTKRCNQGCSGSSGWITMSYAPDHVSARLV